MDLKEFDALIHDAEVKMKRLKALYEQWFQGIERTEPHVPRKDLERLFVLLGRDKPRNTAARFRLQQLVARYSIYTTMWGRVARQIEEGTYQRDLRKVQRQRGAGAERAIEPSAYEIDIDEEADALPDDEIASALSALDLQVPSQPAQKPMLSAFSPFARRPSSATAGAPSPAQSGAQAAAQAAHTQPAAAPGRVPLGAPAPPRAPVGPAAPVAPTPRAPVAPAAPLAPAPPRAPGPAPAPPAPPATFGKPVTATFGKPKLPPDSSARAPGPASAPQAAAPRPPLPPARPAPSPARPPPPPRPAPAASGDEATIKRLYDTYVDARRRNNERVDNLGYDKLAASVQQMKSKLREKHGDKHIDFEVVVQNGRVGIKPKIG